MSILNFKLILTGAVRYDIIFGREKIMKPFKILFCSIISCLLAACCLTACNTDDETVTYSDDPMFKAENWVYMTNGSAKDSGGVPYSLDDGTIKFHNANQAYDLKKDYPEGTLEFMLKGSKNWQIWLLADTVDNYKVNCYKLIYKDGLLYFTTSETQQMLTGAEKENTEYKVNDWNKFKISFSTTSEKVCTASVTVNESRVEFKDLQSGDNVTANGDFIHSRGENFVTGNYMAAKVWYGDCYLQLRSVDDEGKPEVKKIACIGDSITYGANADNSYTDSYPAQLQKRFGGEYNVMNFGKSGATARDSADDPYRKTDEYRGAMLFKPDIAIIMLGSNDSKTYQVPDVNSMVSAYTALLEDLYALSSRTEIYIATSPYAYSSAYNINNANIENIVIPAQIKTAEDNSLKLIDMHEYTKDMNGNYADGIHPTSKGYEYIAYRFWCELTSAQPDGEYVASFKDKK